MSLWARANADLVQEEGGAKQPRLGFLARIGREVDLELVRVGEELGSETGPDLGDVSHLLLRGRA